MEMNRIEGGRMPGPVPPPDAEAAKRAKETEQTTAKRGEDQIEFSQQAREIAESPGEKLSRDARIEAARRKLESGELETLEAYRTAAEKLLKSGDLGKEKE